MECNFPAGHLGLRFIQRWGDGERWNELTSRRVSPVETSHGFGSDPPMGTQEVWLLDFD